MNKKIKVTFIILLVLFLLAILALFFLNSKVIIAKVDAENVSELSIDQNYYRTRFASSDYQSLSIPPIIILQIVSEKQVNPLEIKMGEASLDGFVSSSSVGRFLGLIGIVRINFSEDVETDFDPGYFASLAFEEEMVLMGRGSRNVDFTNSNQIYFRLSESLFSYSQNQKVNPIQITLNKNIQ